MDTDQRDQSDELADNELNTEVASHLEWIHQEGTQWLRTYRVRRTELEQEIDVRWSAAFDAFDLLILVCQRAVTSIDHETLPEPAVRTSAMFMALVPNAIRACQIAKEVRVLIGAGYAAAATSRWRTYMKVKL